MRVHHRDRRSIVGKPFFAFAAAVLIAVMACSDVSTAPRISEKTTSDLVASASIYNTLWQPSVSGAQFVSSVRVSAAGKTESSSIGVSASDSASALSIWSKRRASSATLSAPSAGLSQAQTASVFAQGVGASSIATLKRRAVRVASQTVNGRDLTLAYVLDEGKTRKPPTATVLFVDDKVFSITESEFERGVGRWKLLRSRLTMFDKSGKTTMVSDSKFESESGFVGALRSRAGSLIPTLLSLVQPDALYAATIANSSVLDAGGCLSEGLNALGAAGAVVGAGLLVAAALVAKDAAFGLLIAARASCVEAPGACLIAIAAAALALTGAEKTLIGSQTALAGAVALAVSADLALWNCLHPDPVIGSSGGASGGFGTGTSTGSTGSGSILSCNSYYDVTTSTDANGVIQVVAGPVVTTCSVV